MADSTLEDFDIKITPDELGDEVLSEDLPPDAEHYIPIRRADLVRMLADEPGLSRADEQKFRELCKMLEAVFHFEYHERLEELKELYSGFDPDSDSPRPRKYTREQKEVVAELLLERFQSLLERANYRRISRKEIDEAVEQTGDWGLRLTVDFSIFQQLEIYARGSSIERKKRRPWWRLFLATEIETPVQDRLIVYFRLKDIKEAPSVVSPENTFVKIFKNIPKANIDSLLPGSRVRMTRFDLGRIWVPTVSGLGFTGFKLFNIVAVGLFTNPFTTLMLIVGAIGYGVKSFFGYLRTKDKYQHTLTRSLYFQNLGNNAGVLFHLLDEAEEQECREAILAYYFLWRFAGSDGWSEDYLDRRVEKWIHKRIQRYVDFEVDDALQKLVRLGLAKKDSQNRYSVIGISEALHDLDEAWDNYFKYANPD